MAFITGLLLIDAPASALNNLGSVPGARTDNTSGVKFIRKEKEHIHMFRHRLIAIGYVQH